MNHKTQKIFYNILFYLGAAVLVVIVTVPLYWMISTSLKSKGALMALPIQWIPKKPTLNSYKKVFTLFPFARAMFNSAFITVMYVGITIISASMAAFAIAKIRFKGANFIFALYLTSMMIPVQITLIPMFIIMNKFSLINKYTSVISPAIFKAFAIFLLVQNMRALPDDYLEAARIDGAGLFKIYRDIIMPMMVPTVATLAITTFMEAWNDYLWPLVMLSDKNKMTLTLALNTLNGQYDTEYNVLMAGSLISMVPIIIIYIIAQTQMKQGITVGGVKG
ncbi:carbohydrate ABC transporter permease [Butyrivibrio sp.]|uniref:carbohydrate ABC transporter permease n=1 Tax=Butyrivibrio sp. TaxID=28121 RepID=UPI0025B81B14|nr:carbohydrate ABC transporter permease [Butyrivibrio sp.]MBQ9305561.1 carbohydrate ABC transporter permease [Butyrivibrio sp.]